ncbi:(d)CMP kinase [bacterium]|nr:(d)CMP kinase [bacterium]
MPKLLKVIAIDGPAGSGKSTTAKEVAKRLGWTYLDTGAMYRALGLAVHRAGGNPEELNDVEPLLDKVEIGFGTGFPPAVLLNGEDVSELIRTPEAGQAASQVSTHGLVRKRMVELQRAIGIKQPCVLEGRDTTTVIFPDAGLKIYVDGSVEVRAKRRLHDYTVQGHTMNIEEVIADVIERDKRDMGRKESPLQVAEDAVVIDTTEMNMEEQIQAVMDVALDRFGGSSR